MAFSIDVIDVSWFGVYLMLCAVLVLFLAVLVGSRSSRRFTSWVTAGAIFFSALFTAGVVIFMQNHPVAEQVEEISAQMDALPGVSSSVVLQGNSVPICNQSTIPTKIVVSIITDDGESVDGHLIVSEPKDGACTYELKLPIK